MPRLTSTYALAAILIAAASCSTLGIHERNMPVPGHAWSSGFQPELTFSVTDTSSAYLVFFVFRHTDAYRFNNIWVDITSRSPGDTADNRQRFDLPLSDGKDWTGTGIDDIYEHRILLYREPVRFRRPGTYRVRLAHVMREDPLRHVLSVGLRVEKPKP
jgi:gliding motility-associated lipoprotein GldH